MTLWSLIPSLGEDTWLWHFRETFYICGPILFLAGVFWITSVHLVIIYRMERFEKNREKDRERNEENSFLSQSFSEQVQLTKITYRITDDDTRNGNTETESNNLNIEPSDGFETKSTA